MLHIPLLAHMIEILLFRSPYIGETEVSRFVVRTGGRLFVDVGAWHGRYEILLAKKYRRIIAIEPEPTNMKITIFNMKYSGISNVEFLQCAVSDHDGYMDLNLSLTARTAHYSGTPSKNESINVKTLTLASILRDCIADLVKVDVEGAEWLVMKGAEPVIGNIESWIVELHDRERKQEMEEWFTSRSYSVRWLTENHILARR